MCNGRVGSVREGSGGGGGVDGKIIGEYKRSSRGKMEDGGSLKRKGERGREGGI